MKNKASSLMMIAVCAMLVGCTGGSKTYTIENAPYSLLNGKIAKKRYETLASVGIGKLNYMETSAAQNAEHFANFVDGLLTHNDFGTLELNLAESARQEQDYKEFIFKIRDDENLVWVTSKGKPYKYGGKVQKVTAADFVFGAKLINTFGVASDTGYLMRDFIKGAAEYYVYTQLMEGISDGTYAAEDYDTAQHIERRHERNQCGADLCDTLDTSYKDQSDEQRHDATRNPRADVNGVVSEARDSIGLHCTADT